MGIGRAIVRPFFVAIAQDMAIKKPEAISAKRLTDRLLG